MQTRKSTKQTDGTTYIKKLHKNSLVGKMLLPNIVFIEFKKILCSFQGKNCLFQALSSHDF